MAEIVRLMAIDSGGAELEVEIEVVAGETSILTVSGLEPMRQSFPADNLFVCLMKLRLSLEAKGYLLCCNGARADVFPSGTLQQTTFGRLAYVLRGGRSLGERDIVDILDPAPPAQVATVEAQRRAVLEFFKIDPSRPDTSSK